MAEAPAIEVSRLKKFYGNFLALDQVSFTVPRGQILGYLGPNGAGKSTTVNILVGLLARSSGAVSFDGRTYQREDFAMRRRIGYVPETGGFYESLSGYEFLQMVGRLYHLEENEVERKARGFLELFELERSMHQRLATYSKGMRQKVLISAALLHNPDLIFMDEPLTGLDAHTALLLKELIRQMAREGKTVFYCSHVLDVVERLCDRVIILDHGRIVADGNLEELRRSIPQSGTTTLEEIFKRLTSEEDSGSRVEQFTALMR